MGKQETAFSRKVGEMPWHLISGGLGAGVVAAFVTSPLDVTRTRLQIQRSTQTLTAYRGTFHCLTTILREEGLRGWYRGFGTNLVALTSHWCIYFTSYGQLKAYGIRHGLEEGLLLHLCSAVGAGAIVDVAVNPLWLVKIRLQTQYVNSRLGIAKDRVLYKNSFHALKCVVQQEGILAPWAGLRAQLLGLTHVAVQFPLYELLKSRMANFSDKRVGSLSPFHIFVASTTSKIAASTLTYPHELIRSRLQNQAPTDKDRYRGVIHALRDIRKTDGFKGLYRGLTPTLARAVPACGITFTLYEIICRNVEKWLKK